jgi:dihydroorotase
MIDNFTLFKQVTICDPKSTWHNQKCDVLINSQEIIEISKEINAKDYKTIVLEDAIISPGIFDLQVNCGAPFDNEKETFQSLSNAAVSAGITDCLLMSHLNIPVDNNAQVEFLKNSTSLLPLNFHIAGTISAHLKGNDLANLNEMVMSGCVAFSDNKEKIQKSNLLHLALQYNKLTQKLLMIHAEDASLNLGGQINEGIINVQLGIKGIPNIAEELGVVKSIYLSKYHDELLFINGISTEGSVNLIREAKKQGIKIACSIYGYQLKLTEHDLLDFNSYLKVTPPLRTEKDRIAIIEGLIDGTIDVICSGHQPENNETKDVEFEIASYGMATIENLWSLCLILTDHQCELATIIEKLCHEPRRLLNLPENSINKGNTPSFFVHTINKNNSFNKSKAKSKAVNNPFFESELKGFIYGTYTKGEWFENNH